MICMTKIGGQSEGIIVNTPHTLVFRKETLDNDSNSTISEDKEDNVPEDNDNDVEMLKYNKFLP